jgi:hypothetical protein
MRNWTSQKGYSVTDVERAGLIGGDLVRGFGNEDVGKQDGIVWEVRDRVNCTIQQRQRQV